MSFGLGKVRNRKNIAGASILGEEADLALSRFGARGLGCDSYVLELRLIPEKGEENLKVGTK